MQPYFVDEHIPIPVLFHVRLTNLLLQPKTIFHRFTFAILCQISEAKDAGQAMIKVHNRDFFLDSSLKSIAREWRHRGLPLEEAADRLEKQLTTTYPASFLTLFKGFHAASYLDITNHDPACAMV